MIRECIIVAMKMEENGSTILSAACFRLGVLGTRVTRTFSERVGTRGLTHKQVGLLAVVDAGLFLIFMTFRIFGALLSGLLVTELVYYYILRRSIQLLKDG